MILSIVCGGSNTGGGDNTGGSSTGSDTGGDNTGGNPGAPLNDNVRDFYGSSP
jgi:hypothetical protein